MILSESDLPLEVGSTKISTGDIPVALPTNIADVDWTGALPGDDQIETITGKTLDGANKHDKSNWINDAIKRALRQHEPPSGDEAYAEMEKYLRDKYTLNEWADMMDANPILIELIKNEEYQNAVDRADYLANDDNSLVDSEDADKLREVTNV